MSQDVAKFEAPPTVNEREVYATFLSTRIGRNKDAGEFEQDWYYNSTRVLIHRLLRTPETRSRRRVVVQFVSVLFVDFIKVLVTENVALWKRERLAADGAIVKLVPILQVPNTASREATYGSLSRKSS